MNGGQITAQDSIKRWADQLKAFFDRIAATAAESGWAATYSSKDIKEDPFSLGASVSYVAPVLVLKRLRGNPEAEQRVTFEPVHRFTILAAGRVDVYAHPTLREAMLLRTPDLTNSENLTWEEAEERVAHAPWSLYSSDRIPLKSDILVPNDLKSFLEDLTA